jgi:hypothetical protein
MSNPSLESALGGIAPLPQPENPADTHRQFLANVVKHNVDFAARMRPIISQARQQVAEQGKDEQEKNESN